MKKIILVIFLLVLFMVGCENADDGQNSQKDKNSPQATQELSQQEKTPKQDYAVRYFEPKIYGCDWAIVSFSVDVLNAGAKIPDAYDVKITAENDDANTHEKAQIVGDKGYAVFEDLSEASTYTISVSGLIDDKEIALEEAYTFSTPQRTLTLDQIDQFIFDELNTYNINEENQMLLETQACLSLLGLESGRYGVLEPITQANICRFEYSVNTLDDFVNYDNILGVPNKRALDAMKDILSLDMTMRNVDIIKEFKPAAYELSRYATIDNQGGKLNIEQYILDLIVDNHAMMQIYKKHPFDVDTKTFKSLYADEYKKDIPQEALDFRLLQIAAKNKAQFSKDAEDFLLIIARPGQRLTTLAGSDNELTVNALIAYSYLLIDAYRDTNTQLATSTTYRDYEFQWQLYSQKKGKSVASGRNASWHYDRQKLSYVPGFSNHQYGVAIDFFERETFFETALYTYLKKHGEKYGFYNYYSEPWHWVYLGALPE
jgi:LAS superfamily LD-carboxypeptidase LdcB